MSVNLKFLTFSSSIDPSFWHKLIQVKLDEEKLEEREIPIIGYFLNTVLSSVTVDYSSFASEHNVDNIDPFCLATVCKRQCNYSSPLAKLSGQLFIFNTLQKFKDINKNELVNAQGLRLFSLIKNGQALADPSKLNQFFIISYADLKSYNFLYWFCFPAITSLKYNILVDRVILSDAFNQSQIDSLLISHANLPIECKEYFCAECKGDELICHPLQFYIDTDEDNLKNVYICFIDPSTKDFCPSWSLRNVLALISFHRRTKSINIISLRVGIKFNTSFTVQVEAKGEIDDFKWVGWERNVRGKFGARFVNLGSNINPMSLADSSVDLNLKLMKWRLVPEIDLNLIKSQKCLLLGAGTLGSSVARCLMGWGIRHITFVDSGSVSFSNPVRQSLFTYNDCDIKSLGAKKKALAASDALKRILPTMETVGHVLDIPMPGHSTAKLHNVKMLHDLIGKHDVVFLLTDSRESRWLPTVIASVLNKLAMTVALGFDSYLVLRHGVDVNGAKLGCYFCNDVTAPRNSSVDRTLDQQCTVTRPGASYIASALAVELFVSILQNSEKGAVGPNKECLLGSIPHSIRGFLSNFEQIMPNTMSFNQCIACSNKIKQEYEKNNTKFLENVFASSTYLEELMGLDELQKLSEDADVVELSDDDSISSQ